MVKKTTQMAIATVLAVAITITSISVSNIFSSKAAGELQDLSVLPNSEQISNSTRLPAEYTFFPKIQRKEDGTQITKATPFGDWDRTNANTVQDGTMKPIKGTANIVWIDKDDTSLNGKIGMYYDNVGTYNNKTIGLKVTYLGSSKDSTPNGFALILYNNKLGIRTSIAPEYVKIKYEFFDAETEEPITVKGYQEFSDIDQYQGLSISNYDKIYYVEAAKSNFKYIKSIGDVNDCIQSTIEAITNDTKEQAKIAYTFTGSDITLTWSSSLLYRRYVLEDPVTTNSRAYNGLTSKNDKLDVALNTYYWVSEDEEVFYEETEGATQVAAVNTLVANSDKMIKSEIKDPVKEVDSYKDSYPRTEDITYSITHEVPGELSDNYYASYTIEDQLEDCFNVSVDNVKVLDNSTEEDITNKFNISVDNNLLKVEAKNDFLSSSDFYARAYKVLVTVSVKDGYDLSNYLEVDYYTVPNVAILKIDNDSFSTSEVRVNIKETPTLEVTKQSDKENYDIHEKALYEIKVTQTTPNAIAENVVITDELEEKDVIIDAQSIVLYDKDGNVISDAQVEVTDKSYSITTNRNLGYNEFFTVKYTATIGKNAAGETIKNTVKTKADNASEVSVDNQINVDKKTPVLEITKEVNKNTLPIDGEAKYTIKVRQTVDLATAENVVIKDTFDKEVVSIDKDSIVVKDKDGNKIDNVTVDVNKNSYTINTNANLEYDEYITVTYKVVFSDSSLINSTINNTATAVADNAAEVQTNVTVNILDSKLSITKKSNKETYAIGEVGKYTITVKQTIEGSNAKNVVITDVLDKELLTVNKESVVVKKNDEVIKNAKVNIDGQNLTVKTNTNLTDKDIITVEYNVNFDQYSLVGQAINNTATAVADNVTKVQADNVVKILDSKLSITKQSDNSVYNVGETGKYTITVKQTVEGSNARNVIITDKLSDSLLTVNKESVVVKKNGTVLSNAGITVDGSNLTIITYTNLTYTDTITVEYEVNFKSYSLASKTITNTAVATSDDTTEVSITNSVKIVTSVLKVEKGSDKQAYLIGSTAKYLIKISHAKNSNGKTANNIRLTDVLDTDFGIIDESSFEVTDSKGKVLNNYTLTVATNGYELVFEESFALEKDNYLVIRYDVLYEDESLVDKTVNNIATVTYNESDLITTEHDVKISSDEDEVEDINKEPKDDVYEEVTETQTGHNNTLPLTLGFGILSLLGIIVISLKKIRK